MKYKRSIINKVFSQELNNYDLISSLQKNELEDLYSISRYYAFNSPLYNIMLNHYIRFTTCFNIVSTSKQANIINYKWQKHKEKCFVNYRYEDAIRLIKRSYFIYGDVFICNISNTPVPYYFILDPIRVATPKVEDKSLQEHILFGIEFDNTFTSINAYYFIKKFQEQNYNKYYISSPVFNMDRFDRIVQSKMIKNCNYIFPEQIRGVPLLTPMFETLARIERLLKIDMDYFEAINSLILTLKTDRAIKSLESLKKYSFKQQVDDVNANISTQPIVGLETPSIIIGSDYAQLLADNRNSNANANSIKLYLGKLASFLAMPTFFITGNYADINFSSGKMAIKNFIDYCKAEIKHDIDNIYKDIYINFVNSLIANGIIEDDGSGEVYNFNVDIDFSDYEDIKILTELIKSGMIEKEDIAGYFGYKFDNE